MKSNLDRTDLFGQFTHFIKLDDGQEVELVKRHAHL